VRGVPFIYYGEEIGMEHYEIPLVHGLDPVAVRHRHVPQWLARRLSRLGMLLNRDECRSPMQWDSGVHAGFSAGTVKPWLSLHPRASTVNVAAQADDPTSLLNCYRGLLALRKRLAPLRSGALQLLRAPADVVAYRRLIARTGQSVSVYLNFGAREARINDTEHAGGELFSNVRGRTLPFTGNYELGPYEGVVISRLPLSDSSPSPI
jgi:glycosidase